MRFINASKFRKLFTSIEIALSACSSSRTIGGGWGGGIRMHISNVVLAGTRASNCSYSIRSGISDVIIITVCLLFEDSLRSHLADVYFVDFVASARCPRQSLNAWARNKFSFVESTSDECANAT
jgi:hypothetical protein